MTLLSSENTCQVNKMKIDDITRQSLLYDFYGALLSERQKQVMGLYHEENLSLAEIADEFGISRQGVHDALQKAEKSLEVYEAKLGLVKKFDKTTIAVSDIDSRIERLLSELNEKHELGSSVILNEKTNYSDKLAVELEEIRNIIDKLEE